MPAVGGCPCGVAHELPAGLAAVVAGDGGGPVTVVASARGRAWEVPAVFVAAHGLRAGRLAAVAGRYGFAGAPVPAWLRRPPLAGRSRRRQPGRHRRALGWRYG